MNSLSDYAKRFSFVWLKTILTVDMILLIGIPIVLKPQLNGEGIGMSLVLVFVLASLGAFFSSFIPLIIYIYLHSKFNQAESKMKAILIHAIASSVGYITTILLVNSFALKNNNIILLVLVYQLIGIVFLLYDNKKHNLSTAK